MCEAIEEMMREREEKGKAEGMVEGKAKGIAEGREEGMIEILANLVKDGILTLKDAATRANMTESAFEAAVKKLP